MSRSGRARPSLHRTSSSASGQVRCPCRCRADVCDMVGTMVSATCHLTAHTRRLLNFPPPTPREHTYSPLCLSSARTCPLLLITTHTPVFLASRPRTYLFLFPHRSDTPEEQKDAQQFLEAHGLTFEQLKNPERKWTIQNRYVCVWDAWRTMLAKCQSGRDSNCWCVQQQRQVILPLHVLAAPFFAVVPVALAHTTRSWA